MKNLIVICAVVAAVALFAGSVQAHCHGGGYGFGYVQPHMHWHDTSHFDYHPGYIIDHGSHNHVVPGHYHLHNTGHYDLHW